MGYESKVYICKRHTYENVGAWNEVIAAMNMVKMGHNFYELFATRLDGDFYGMDGAMSRFVQHGDEAEPELVDNYGDPLTYAPLVDVLKWCNEAMEQPTKYIYWRIAVLQKLLETLQGPDMIVVHYGC